MWHRFVCQDKMGDILEKKKILEIRFRKNQITKIKNKKKIGLIIIHELYPAWETKAGNTFSPLYISIDKNLVQELSEMETNALICNSLYTYNNCAIDNTTRYIRGFLISYTLKQTSLSHVGVRLIFTFRSYHRVLGRSRVIREKNDNNNIKKRFNQVHVIRECINYMFKAFFSKCHI